MNISSSFVFTVSTFCIHYFQVCIVVFPCVLLYTHGSTMPIRQTVQHPVISDGLMNRPFRIMVVCTMYNKFLTG